MTTKVIFNNRLANLVYSQLGSKVYSLEEDYVLMWKETPAIIRSYVDRYKEELILSCPYCSIDDISLTVKKDFLWDGPSGPFPINDKTLMPTLIHDALYSLMYDRILPISHRKFADLLFYKLLRMKKLGRFISFLAWMAVRLFGESSLHEG